MTAASTEPIDPRTRVGVLELTIADLDRSLAYYTDAFGLTLLERQGRKACLGTGEAPLLLLEEEPGARPFPHDRFGYTGLYHFAVLVPSRVDLGRWLSHWLDIGRELPGQGDHLVSEALYLTDPDGNGIEIYRDRPRESWSWSSGRVQMAADPVDIRGMMAEAEEAGGAWNGLPAGTRLGHMHLQVGDIPTAADFYHGILGFDITATMPSALFVSAGGYHHHIGMNIWHSRGAEPRPQGVAGLNFFTVNFETAEARAAVTARLAAAGIPTTVTPADEVILEDPWQNTIVLHVGDVSLAQATSGLVEAAGSLHERSVPTSQSENV